MPNSKSATKRLRQNFVRRDRNRAVRSAVRNQVKKVRMAIANGDADEATTQLRIAAKKLDQAGARMAIHPNAAARTKSRLSKQIRLLKSPSE